VLLVFVHNACNETSYVIWQDLLQYKLTIEMTSGALSNAGKHYTTNIATRASEPQIMPSFDWLKGHCAL